MNETHTNSLSFFIIMRPKQKSVCSGNTKFKIVLKLFCFVKLVHGEDGETICAFDNTPIYQAT